MGWCYCDTLFSFVVDAVDGVTTMPPLWSCVVSLAQKSGFGCDGRTTSPARSGHAQELESIDIAQPTVNQNDLTHSGLTVKKNSSPQHLPNTSKHSIPRVSLKILKSLDKSCSCTESRYQLIGDFKKKGELFKQNKHEAADITMGVAVAHGYTNQCGSNIVCCVACPSVWLVPMLWV